MSVIFPTYIYIYISIYFLFNKKTFVKSKEFKTNELHEIYAIKNTSNLKQGQKGRCRWSCCRYRQKYQYRQIFLKKK